MLWGDVFIPNMTLGASPISHHSFLIQANTSTAEGETSGTGNKTDREPNLQDYKKKSTDDIRIKLLPSILLNTDHRLSA